MLPLTCNPGWHGERGDRVVEGAAQQHNSNAKLFERALEAGRVAEELDVSVSDAMWALSHVRTSTAAVSAALEDLPQSPPTCVDAQR